MAAVGPGLARLINECTQPDAPIFALTKHFNDTPDTDAVYQALISRAWTEPTRSVPIEGRTPSVVACPTRRSNAKHPEVQTFKSYP